jgi:hypothetical protein
MKRALISIVPLVALVASGCAVAFEDQESFEERTVSHGEELDQVDALGDPAPPEQQQPGSGPLESQTASGDGPRRPDPDPWFTTRDPNRPDPDPWAAPKSTSTGAKE